MTCHVHLPRPDSPPRPLELAALDVIECPNCQRTYPVSMKHGCGPADRPPRPLEPFDLGPERHDDEMPLSGMVYAIVGILGASMLVLGIYTLYRVGAAVVSVALRMIP